MRFCSECGQSTAKRVPAGEDRERSVCDGCGTIHYQNPKLVVGCIVEHEGRILLCKRAIEPRRGYWTIPAGFLELGESAMAGAIRETHEEAGARVRIRAPYAHFDIPHIGQAYVLYRAEMLDGHFAPGVESLEAKLVLPNEVPWGELAFPVIRHALELLDEDLTQGRYRTHHAALVRDAGGYALREHLAFAVGDSL
jgi:ADP-ribose pyrophosphatase YjhB (NUDIX family)